MEQPVGVGGAFSEFSSFSLVIYCTELKFYHSNIGLKGYHSTIGRKVLATEGMHGAHYIFDHLSSTDAFRRYIKRKNTDASISI
jgi:hypothetical protein